MNVLSNVMITYLINKSFSRFENAEIKRIFSVRNVLYALHEGENIDFW